MFDPKKPCRTRDGRPAEVQAVLTVPFATGENIIATVGGCAMLYYRDGHMFEGVIRPEDLINIPQARHHAKIAAAYMADDSLTAELLTREGKGWVNIPEPAWFPCRGYRLLDAAGEVIMTSPAQETTE